MVFGFDESLIQKLLTHLTCITFLPFLSLILGKLATRSWLESLFTNFTFACQAFYAIITIVSTAEKQVTFCLFKSSKFMVYIFRFLFATRKICYLYQFEHILD